MRARAAALSATSLLLATACGSSAPPADPGGGVPARPTLQVIAGDQQVARWGTAVAIAPTVQLRTATGALADTLVTFSVAGGGGSIRDSITRTDALGTATLGGWTLGPAPGVNQLRVLAGGVTRSITAVAVAGPPVSLQLVSGDAQSGIETRPVPVAPAVRVTDAGGFPVVGVSVRFTVTGGGGSVVPDSATTDALGKAAATQWILGAPGANALRIEAAGLPPVAATAQAAALAVGSFRVVSGADQSGFASNFSAAPPVIELLSPTGSPLGDVEVQFTADDPTALVVPAAARTDASGRVAVAAWRLGSGTGVQQLTARVALSASPPPAVAVARVAPAPASAFGIDVVAGALPSSVATAVQLAASRWPEVIVGDLPDVTIAPGTSLPEVRVQLTGSDSRTCVPSLPAATTGTIDDVRLYMYVVPIDGAGSAAGNVVAAAAPAHVRDGSGLPLTGCVFLDEADVPGLVADGRLNDVVLHEVGHVLGFGTRWEAAGLLRGACTLDASFAGAGAAQAFAALRGGAAGPVPVENVGACGGNGRDRHWREAALQQELMTTNETPGGNPLSALTALQFRDLGYLVNDAAADPFALPGVTPFARTTSTYRREVLPQTPSLPVIDRHGRVVGRSR